MTRDEMIALAHDAANFCATRFKTDQAVAVRELIAALSTPAPVASDVDFSVLALEAACHRTPDEMRTLADTIERKFAGMRVWVSIWPSQTQLNVTNTASVTTRGPAPVASSKTRARSPSVSR